MRWRLGFVTLVMCGALVGDAHAGDVKKARAHYERGTTLYDLRRFAEAAAEYERAYEEHNTPALLFNIGQAYRFANDHEKAISSFRAYLRRVPNAENRADVEARIVELQKLAADKANSDVRPPGNIVPPEPTDAATKPAATTSTPAASEPSTTPATTEPTATSAVISPRQRIFRIAGPALLGVGVVGIAAGAGLYASAVGSQHALEKSGSVYNPGRYDQMKTFEAAGFALLGVGLAGLATGAALTALGYKPTRDRVALAPMPLASGAGVLAQGRF